MQIELAHYIVGHPFPQLKKVDDDLKTLQDLVGGYIEMMRMRNGLVMVCNEEGRNMRLPIGFAVMSTVGVTAIHGNFFVCRQAGSKFTSIRESDINFLMSDVIAVSQKETKNGEN